MGWILNRIEYTDPEDAPRATEEWKRVERAILHTAGPAEITPEEIRRLRDGEGYEFRMWDDDRAMAVYGRCSTPDSFAPLDDYGTGGIGCTMIEYRNAKGEWETL